MPGLDRTGPMGNGPMTGRRLGYCSGYVGTQKPSETNQNEITNTNEPLLGFGRRFWPRGGWRGFGFGSGRGRGFGGGGRRRFL